MTKNFLIVLKNLQHAIKTASKRAIQKTAEATHDLIGNKIADKVTSISTKPSNNNNNNNEDAKITVYKKMYVSRRKAANY